MTNENSTNLWQVLHDILGIKNPSGNCLVWTRMAYPVLKTMTNCRIIPMGTLVERAPYSMIHWYLKGTCPLNNSIEVAGERLKGLLKSDPIKQMVKNMPQLEGIIYRGRIEGSPGEEIILDGTAEQFTEKEEMVYNSWGFYGPIPIAKKRLGGAYRIGKEAVQMAQSLSML